jgi:hypothetical protein
MRLDGHSGYIGSGNAVTLRERLIAVASMRKVRRSEQ